MDNSKKSQLTDGENIIIAHLYDKHVPISAFRSFLETMGKMIRACDEGSPKEEYKHFIETDAFVCGMRVMQSNPERSKHQIRNNNEHTSFLLGHSLWWHENGYRDCPTEYLRFDIVHGLRLLTFDYTIPESYSDFVIATQETIDILEKSGCDPEILSAGKHFLCLIQSVSN